MVKRMKFYLLSNFWMKPVFRLIMVVSIFNVGCIHSRHIQPGVPSDDLIKMNKELAGKHAQIALLHDDAVLSAKNVHVFADTVFIDTKTEERQQRAIADIHRIVVKNHARGAVEGFAGGALAWGGFVGVAYLATLGDSEPSEGGFAEGTLPYYVFLVGTSLPVLGTIIGAASGSQKLFVLNQK